VKMEILGLKELDGMLGRLPEALRRNVVLAALKNAGRPIVRDARARAHRGIDPFRRGSKKQRDSGQAALMGAGADSIKARTLPPESQTNTAIAIGPDTRHFYMRYLEHGTARQSPQPFLAPAFDTNKESVAEAIGIELWKSLDATVKRHAKLAAAGTLPPLASEAYGSQ
jgi:HK97 gp10 family phage protein